MVYVMQGLGNFLGCNGNLRRRIFNLKPNECKIYRSAIHQKFERTPFRDKQSLDAFGFVRIFLLLPRDWIARLVFELNMEWVIKAMFCVH